MGLARLSIVSILLSLTACSHQITEKEKEFAEIVDGFPIVELPVSFVDGSMKSGGTSDAITNPKTKAFKDISFKETSIQLLGRVYKDEENIFMIGYAIGDFLYPELVVYDREGKKLMVQEIYGWYMGADPEYSSVCESTLYPNMDYMERDSIFFEKYNEAQNGWVAGTGTCTVYVRKYRVTKDGHLTKVSIDSTARAWDVNH